MRDGTMALCAHCHRAIYCWWDWSMVPLGEHAEYQEFEAVDQHWTHWVHPADGHDADPMRPFFDRTSRTLVCAGCRQPQTWDRGWHCERCDHT